MNAVEFEGHNMKIAEDQEEYQTLPALSSNDEIGRNLVFCFELTEEEIKQVRLTGRIYLKQYTFGSPMQPLGMSLLKEINIPA